MFGSSKNPSIVPRFFCEKCGVEVTGNAKDCPNCGRSFASVLCPACGFTGGGSEFMQGCPVCGYSSAVPASRNSGSRRGFPETRKPAGALPLWVYILTTAAFTGVLTALFFTCVH